MHGNKNILRSLGQKLQMKLICLLQRNEEEWETENQDGQEIPSCFFFSFLRVFWKDDLGFFAGLF